MPEISQNAIAATNGTGNAIELTSASNTCTANVTNIPGRNRIINGNFDIWQRSTSTTFGAGTAYVADRWNCGGAASTTVSRQAFTLGQTDVPNEPKYYLQSAWTANSQNYEVAQKIEGVRTLAGQKATVSFWIKRSSGTIGLGARLVQYFGTGGSPSATVITSLGTPTLTTSWQKLTYTVDVPSISGKTIGSNNDDSLWFSLQVNNANTGTIQLAQVQVEKGNYATDFDHRTYGDELAKCQRYFHRIEAGNGHVVGIGGTSLDASNMTYDVRFPTSMRAIPTYEGSATSMRFAANDDSNERNFNQLSIWNMGTVSGVTLLQNSSGGATGGQSGHLQFRANDGFMNFSAEL